MGQFWFFLALLLWSSAEGSPFSPHSSSSNILHLNKDNFRSLVVESGMACLVEFYNISNHMTSNLAPITDVLALDYGGFMTIGAVSMEEEKELTIFFSHRDNRDPFLVLFPPEKSEDTKEQGPFAGKDFTYYQGPVEATAIAEFTVSWLHDRHVTRVVSSNRAAFHDVDGIPKTLWFSKDNKKPPMILQALSLAFEGRMGVGYVRANETTVFDHYGIPHHEMYILVIAKNWQMHHYGGKPTGSRLFRFIEKYALPRPGASTPTPSPPPSNRKHMSKKAKSKATRPPVPSTAGLKRDEL